MNDLPDAQAAPTGFDPIKFALERPLATPSELAVACGQLIDGIGDLTGCTVERTVTATLSAITISWLASSIPSEEWIADVEQQLMGFAACNGIRVVFRRH